MDNLTSESPLGHRFGPVSLKRLALALARGPFGIKAAMRWYLGDNLMFAHVLNVPESEGIWPGEAVELFLQPFFAKSPYTGEFVHQGMIFEHMRCETLRLCSGKFSAIDYMKDELNFYYEFEGPYPYGFGDRCDDEGELLLDQALTWDE